MHSGSRSVLVACSTTVCEPWCATHDDPATGVDDGLCRSRAVEVGEHVLHLQWDGDLGDAVVRAETRSGDWIEFDNAPWLASLLSSLLDVASTPPPAEPEAFGVVAGLVGRSRQQLAESLGLDLESASRRHAERIADAMAVHGVSIAED